MLLRSAPIGLNAFVPPVIKTGAGISGPPETTVTAPVATSFIVSSVAEDPILLCH